MTLNRILFSSILICLVFVTQAQDLVTDRPDITESALVVPARNIQLEMGGSLENFEFEQVLNTPSFLFRIGINNRFELRLGSTYSFANDQYGFNATEIGLKVNLNENRNANYQHAMLLGVGVPYLVATDLRSNSFSTPSIIYAFQFDLSKRVGFSSNIGGIWDSESNGARFIYSASFAFALTPKLGLYTEIYGFVVEQGNGQVNFDGGFTYLLDPLVQLDISYGNRLFPNTNYNYISAGFSWRFSVAKKKTIDE